MDNLTEKEIHLVGGIKSVLKDIILTEKEIHLVGDIKSILKDIILSNHGNTLEKTIEIFQEVVNEEYKKDKIKIIDVRLDDSEYNIGIHIEVNKKKFSFSLSTDIPEDDDRFNQLIDHCEPWRKTNLKLVESEKKLKEWANSYG